VILTLSRASLFLSGLLEPTMMTTGNSRVLFTIRLLGAGSLLLLLLLFARYGAEPAAWAHFATSVLIAIAALWAIVPVLRLSLADAVSTFTPGLILSAATATVILATSAPLAPLGELWALVLCLAAVGLAWLLLMIVFLKRRALVLPSP